MKLSCLQENLERGLAVVGRAVAGRAILPVTQNVLLSSDQGMLKLSATNLDISITTWIGAMVEQEGSTTVPHRLLTDLVNAMPSDRVDLELRSGDPAVAGSAAVLNIACGLTVTNLNTVPAREFPPPPPPAEGNYAAIDAPILRAGIAMTAPCAANDEARPALTGIHMELEQNRLTMAAADGFRLATYHQELTEPAAENNIKVIVPAKAMLEVQRLTAEQSMPVRIALSRQNNHITFKTENAELVAQLITASFPEYRKLVPEHYETRAVLSAEDLKHAVESAGAFAQQGSNIVRMEFSPAPGNEKGGKLKVSAKSEHDGYNESELDITEMDGDTSRIAFNIKYLRDVANVMGRRQVVIETTTPSQPAAFRPDEPDANFVMVAMPMYVQW